MKQLEKILSAEGDPKKVIRKHLLRINGSQVSNEGLGELFKDLKNKIFKGKGKPGVYTDSNYDKSWMDNEAAEAFKKLREAIKRFYLNDSWLNKQTFVTEDITDAGFTKSFVTNNTNDDNVFERMDKAINHSKEWISRYSEQLSKLQSEVYKIDRETYDHFKNKTVMEPGDIEYIAKQTNRLNNLKAPTVKSVPFKGYGIMNHVPIDVDTGRKFGDTKRISLDVKVAIEPKALDKIKPLDKEGVKKAANLIISLLDDDYVDDDYISWLDVDDADDYSKIPGFGDYLDNYMDRFYYQTAMDDYYYGMFKLIPFYKVAIALEYWIDLSIK